MFCEHGWWDAPLLCHGLWHKQQRRTCACAPALPAHRPKRWYTFPFSSNCVSPDGPIVGGNWTIQGDSVVPKCLYRGFA